MGGMVKTTPELFTRIQELVEQDCKRQTPELPRYSGSMCPYHLKRINGIMLEKDKIKAIAYVENFGNVTFTVDYKTIEDNFFKREQVQLIKS